MNEPELLARLADVDLPPPAPGPDLVLVVSITALVLLGAGMVFWFVKRRRAAAAPTAAQQALTRLEDIHTAWRSGTLTQREAAYQLATLLRLGLGEPQLQRRAPGEPAWQETLQLLAELRYPRHTEHVLSAQIFANIRRWLQESPHRVSG